MFIELMAPRSSWQVEVEPARLKTSNGRVGHAGESLRLRTGPPLGGARQHETVSTSVFGGSLGLA